MTSIKQKNRPEDLISAVEAAKLVDRSKSSIRAWVRDKKLTGYRADPEKSNSSLMVSTQELIAFCAQNVAVSGKPKGRTKTPSASIEKLKEDKQKLEAEVNRLSLELKSLQADMAKLNTIMIKTEALSDSKERLISAHEATIADLKGDRAIMREAHQQEVDRLKNQLAQATEYLSMPWWKKWNSSVPLLTG